MKPKIVIGIVVIVIALVFLIMSGFKDSTKFYLTVPELLAQDKIPVGEGLRVSGYVVPESISWDPDKIELQFKMAENSDTLAVIHKGIKPDQLEDAQQVVAEGFMDSDGIFHSNKLLLKCPSKYEVKKDG